MQGDAAPLLTLASGIACAWSMSLSMGFLAIVSALLALALGRAARRAHRAAVCAEMARDGVLIQTWMGAASR
jgi:membrane protein implicated in regulation of membrane protease activity